MMPAPVAGIQILVPYPVSTEIAGPVCPAVTVNQSFSNFFAFS